MDQCKKPTRTLYINKDENDNFHTKVKVAHGDRHRHMQHGDGNASMYSSIPMSWPAMKRVSETKPA